jgi:CheY-like chemotaxis protein
MQTVGLDHGDILRLLNHRGALSGTDCEYAEACVVPVPGPCRALTTGSIGEMKAAMSKIEDESKQTVLVVDDEPAIRDIVATLLEDEGYVVRRANDGMEALAAVDDTRIDLVLSDVIMPGLDGASLARKLRRRGDGIPVVLMSAVYAEVDLPGVRFVPKPFEIDRLLGTVASALAAS